MPKIKLRAAVRAEGKEFVFFYPPNSVDSFPHDFYWLDFEQIDTIEELVRMIHHMSFKTWFNRDIAKDFITLWAAAMGINPYTMKKV